VPFSKATHPTAAGGGYREDLLAQWSKFCDADSKQRISGTARGSALLGSCPQTTGQRPATPSESAIAAFDGRRLSKVLLRYS